MIQSGLHLIVSVALLMVLGCSGNREKQEIEEVVRAYTRASADQNLDAVKTLTTAEMFAQYQQMHTQLQQANALLKRLGQEPLDLSRMNLISVSCDLIEGDRAYVNLEIRLDGKTNYERVVLRKESDRWKVAGKQ